MTASDVSDYVLDEGPPQRATTIIVATELTVTAVPSFKTVTASGHVTSPHLPLSHSSSTSPPPLSLSSSVSTSSLIPINSSVSSSSSSAPSSRTVIVGSVAAGAITLSLFFVILLLWRRRNRKTPYGFESAFFRKKKAVIVPFPQPPEHKLETLPSLPRDEKAKAARVEVEQQIAAIQRQLNDLRHQSAAASSSERRRVSTMDHDAEVLSLRQLVEDMRLEIERLSTRDRQDSGSPRHGHEPPPQYQPGLLG